ncbi:MAG: fatty acid desaturase [Alphaproteobacteria bacterium]
MRLFIIQHDCGHGALFGARLANDWTGRFVSVLTMTPYRHWQRDHAIHHSVSGRLSKRGTGDVHTLTVREYRAKGTAGRIAYRLFRHPLVLFVVGPAYLFYIRYRVPVGNMRNRQAWLSTLGTDISILVAALVMIWFVGLESFLLVHIPITLLGASAGVWLFFVQHQFEHTIWNEDAEWDWYDAALNGSSNYALPPVLQWLTGNIGLHHIHHLCSRVPFYRLPQVVRKHPELADIGRLGFLKSLSCINLTLWDESEQRLVSFRAPSLRQPAT